MKRCINCKNDIIQFDSILQWAEAKFDYYIH